MLINADVHIQGGTQLAPRLEELTAILFRDGDEGPDVHGSRRKAVSTELFRHRGDLHVEERWQLSYDRLRALNEEVLCPEGLARDPRAPPALHEWTSVVDGATATVAGIHYNLFLGSLLDDDCDLVQGRSRDDLRPRDRPEPAAATGQERLTDPGFLRRALTTAERHWHLAARRDLRGGAASGLLLAENALTADQVRSLPGTLRGLTARLAPHLPSLTEAFDIPEEHLSSLPMLTSA